ncbi:two-component system activity regulator YycH, partial [Staphylococcus aureus]|uniref:two-component system activity regulator YycH n=1 Tax=Staphylococcus aureus TaxID=1280 RepID=UPI00065BBA7C
NAKVPNHFNFNRLVIDHDSDDNFVLYDISKDRRDYVELTTTTKNDHYIEALGEVKKDMHPYADIITNKGSIDRSTHVFSESHP